MDRRLSVSITPQRWIRSTEETLVGCQAPARSGRQSMQKSTSETQKAREELEHLAESPAKAKALAALAEIDTSNARLEASVDKLSTALDRLTPTPLEERVFQLLPWLVGLLALAALWTGFDAILTSEYCSRYRSGGTSCTFGERAQLEGGFTVLIGLLLALVPLVYSKGWRIALLLFSSAFFALLAASLIVRSAIA